MLGSIRNRSGSRKGQDAASPKRELLEQRT